MRCTEVHQARMSCFSSKLARRLRGSPLRARRNVAWVSGLNSDNRMPRTLFRADAVVATWLCLCALCLVVAVSAVELDRTRHPHQRPHLTRAGRQAGYGSVNRHVHRAHAEPSEEDIDNAENTLQPAPTTDADAKSNSDPSSVSTSQSVNRKYSSATSLSPVSVCVQDDRPDVLLPMAVQAVNGKELTTYCTSPRVIRRLYQVP